VLYASNKGKTNNANIVQIAHVFSHAHLRVNFIGRVKLPFIAPAKNNRENPKADPFTSRTCLRSSSSESKSRLAPDGRTVHGSNLCQVLATFAGSEIHRRLSGFLENCS
jgi:hypothetical protein